SAGSMPLLPVAARSGSHGENAASPPEDAPGSPGGATALFSSATTACLRGAPGLIRGGGGAAGVRDCGVISRAAGNGVSGCGNRMERTDELSVVGACRGSCAIAAWDGSRGGSLYGPGSPACCPPSVFSAADIGTASAPASCQTP